MTKKEFFQKLENINKGYQNEYNFKLTHLKYVGYSNMIEVLDALKFLKLKIDFINEMHNNHCGYFIEYEEEEFFVYDRVIEEFDDKFSRLNKQRIVLNNELHNKVGLFAHYSKIEMLMKIVAELQVLDLILDYDKFNYAVNRVK